jgi:fucose 4-O-acetylase-like acetyltransferase
MTTTALKRIDEIDFLKAILIILMVMFHLVWFSEGHPYVKQMVYTFHMPAFLLLSGYFCHTAKAPRAFLRQVLWFFIPYAIMELGYTVMCFFLPIHEHISTLSPSVLAYHLFIHPLGPYWYFHTLIICLLLTYAVFRTNLCRSLIGNILLLCVLLFALRSIVVFANAMYFVAGVVLFQSGIKYLHFFRPTILAVFPLVWLCNFPENLDRASIAGIAINYLVISLCLSAYPHLFQKSKSLLLFIGRNTLVILLFSPVFTLLAKFFIPLFSWDPTRICFMLVSVSFTLAGCMAVAWLFDALHLSPLFFGCKKVLK